MNAHYKQIGGKWMLVADAKFPTGDSNGVRNGKLAILTTDLKQIMQRNQATAIVQLYKLVIPGIILTRHIFKGLNRPLYCDEEPRGDKHKLIYTRSPGFDFRAIVRSGSEMSFDTIREKAPLDRVFSVIVSPNRNQHKDDHPEIDGWIEHWNWTEADERLSEAPIGWIDRYDRKLWTLA